MSTFCPGQGGGTYKNEEEHIIDTWLFLGVEASSDRTRFVPKCDENMLSTNACKNESLCSLYTK